MALVQPVEAFRGIVIDNVYHKIVQVRWDANSMIEESQSVLITLSCYRSHEARLANENEFMRTAVVARWPLENQSEESFLANAYLAVKNTPEFSAAVDA